IRAENQTKALNRIKNNADKYNINLDKYYERICPLIGDLNLPQFGLEEKQWQNITETISNIYHCGGIVNMVKSYEELKSTNFQGTQEIIKLACINTRKKVNFASTLSVFVATDQNYGICDENDYLTHTKLVYGGYAQSKWIAEYFIHQIPKHILDINIFRLGLLTGHSQTGKSADHDYLIMFIKGLSEIGCIPVNYDNITLDVTPVDYAAKAMIYLSLLPESQCYHLANNQGFDLQMIVDVLNEKGGNIQETTINNWLKEVYNKGIEKSHISAAYLALCRLIPEDERFIRYRTMDLFQSTNMIFNQDNVKKGLRETNIVCPQPNQQLLEKYITFSQIMRDRK
ncbi:MAG TPA: thioester reductase domain-containing protein, partial [Allocoleopsis sp.]